MKFTIACMILGFICVTGCDWSEITMPKFNTPIKVAEDANEPLCYCPDKDIVLRIMTPSGPMLYLIKKGSLNDINDNPYTMYREDYEELMKNRININNYKAQK